MKLVDVVIPAYEADLFLSDAYQSVCAQTILAKGWRISLYVVDDGSSTWNWFPANVGNEQVDLYVLHETHRGVSAARNTGAAVGDAPMLAFLDADDIWEPMKLETSIAALAGHDLAVCTSGMYFGSRNRPMLGERVTFQSLIAHDHILTSSVMTRAAFAATGGFDEKLGLAEDLDWAFRALRAGVEYLHVAGPLFFYRRHQEQSVCVRRQTLIANAKAIRQRERSLPMGA